MAYYFYLGNVLLPIPPSKLELKISNNNKTYDLINYSQINVLKNPGLSSLEFEVVLPNTKYPFAMYKNNFQNEVMNADKPVLLDFWASWCAPCRMVVPIIEEIAGERPDIKVGKINVDEQPELASKFGIMSIPTLVVMKNGKIVTKVSGARPKKAILEML